MTIDREPHFDPDESWELLKDWIVKNVKDPDGEPVNEDVAKILSVGAFVGMRFGLVSRQFALAVAEYGNSLENHPVFTPITEAFARDYAEWLRRRQIESAEVGPGEYTGQSQSAVPADSKSVRVDGRQAAVPRLSGSAETVFRRRSDGWAVFQAVQR